MANADQETTTFHRARSPTMAFALWTAVVFSLIQIAVNSAEGILHSYFPLTADQWVDLSRGATNWIGRFVPALSFVGAKMEAKGYLNRADFVQNVLAMNFIVVAMYIPLIGVSSVSAVIGNKEIVSRRSDWFFSRPRFNLVHYVLRRLPRRIRLPVQSAIFGVFFIWTFWFTCSGNAFAHAWINDQGIFVIWFFFACLEFFYFGLAVLLPWAFIELVRRETLVESHGDGT